MNREILEEKALLYALGSLPSEEVDEFENLVRNDRELQVLVHQNQELNELSVAECELEEPPFHAYSRIMDCIDRESEETGAQAMEPVRESGSGQLVSFFGWGGWAAAACAVVALGLAGFGTKSASHQSDIVLNNLANPKLVAVQTPSEGVGMEDRMLELVGIAEAYWFAREGVPSEQLLEADENTEVASLSGGFTVFDKKYNIGFIAVENMPRESVGKSYHVWAKTGRNSEVVRAGALPIGDESRGLFFFDLSSLPTGTNVDNVSFFVTEESSEDPLTPSSMVVLSDF